MTKYKILIFAFLPLCLFGDCADCEVYKTQVVNDCNALDSSLQSVANNVNSSVGFATSGYNSSSDPNDKAIFSTIIATLSNTQGYIDSVSVFVSSIRATAQSLQCNASSNTVGSCDCSQYLQTLIGLVQTCNQTVFSVKSGVDSLVSSIGTVGPDDSDIVSTVNAINNTFDDLASYIEQFLSVDSGELPYTVSDFYDIFTEFYSSVTNYSSSKFSTLNRMSFRFMTTQLKIQDESYLSKPLSFFARPTTANNLSLTELLYAGFSTLLLEGSSLNNYARTNLEEFVKSRHHLYSIDTNIVSLSSKFSIFNDFVFSADSPLSMYTDEMTDGSYHDYLTNYYIKVSKGQQSGSDNFTNWFSRIEILLASLVFKDDGTNFVDNADNTSELENTLSQSVDTLSQAVSLPQNVTGKIDNMGRSFLGLLGEWRTIVIGNSLPSQFVLCDINLGSQSRDSSGVSSVSSFRLETSLDSGEFRQFLDFCHAVTTILFTMLFVWLSVMLLSFLLASLAKLAQFCYLVYSALFGG